jgi:RHS repeat-associated protein
MTDVADDNKVYYYHFDGLGSVAALTDINGLMVEYYEYDVYGAPTIRDLNGTILDTSQFGNPYMFTGREYDTETDLYYYRARYYSPTIGRFLQTI